MRKWLLLGLLLGLLIFPSTASAQNGIKLDAIRVDLWPEYDKPTMLVISHFAVSRDTALPATITLRFPKEGNLVAVAVEKSSGPFDKNFTGPIVQGNWQTITINVDTYDAYRIEYYQPLTRDGNKRQFKYQWFGDYAVNEFTVAVLLPADSTDLVTSPALQGTSTTENGKAISGAIIKNDLKMGNSFQFDLAYQRTSDALTAPDQAGQVQPSEPVGANTPGRVSITNLPWIIGGFGVALIAIALFSYWRSTQSGEPKPQRRRHRQAQTQAEKVEGESQGEIYCHECGTRAHPGDRFCRTCGSRLRLE
jgi:hypothetical protein